MILLAGGYKVIGRQRELHIERQRITDSIKGKTRGTVVARALALIPGSQLQASIRLMP